MENSDKALVRGAKRVYDVAPSEVFAEFMKNGWAPTPLTGIVQDEDDFFEPRREGRERPEEAPRARGPLSRIPTTFSVTVLDADGFVTGELGGDLNAAPIADYLLGFDLEEVAEHQGEAFTVEGAQNNFRAVAVALPNTGVTRVGLVENTAEPLPVLSVSAVARLAELKEPNDVVVLLDIITPVRFGILVVEVAVPVSAPTNVVAVIIPVEFIFLTTAKSFCVN